MLRERRLFGHGRIVCGASRALRRRAMARRRRDSAWSSRNGAACCRCASTEPGRRRTAPARRSPDRCGTRSSRHSRGCRPRGAARCSCSGSAAAARRAWCARSRRECRVVGVESSAEVLDAARRWFELDALGVEVVHDCARALPAPLPRALRPRDRGRLRGRGARGAQARLAARARPRGGGAPACAAAVSSSPTRSTRRATSRARCATLFPASVRIDIEGYDNADRRRRPGSLSALGLRAAAAAHPLLRETLPQLSFRTSAPANLLDCSNGSVLAAHGRIAAAAATLAWACDRGEPAPVSAPAQSTDATVVAGRARGCLRSASPKTARPHRSAAASRRRRRQKPPRDVEAAVAAPASEHPSLDSADARARSGADARSASNRRSSSTPSI